VHIHIDQTIRSDHRELRRLILDGFRSVDPDGVEVRVERSRKPRESFSGRAYWELPARARLAPGTEYLIRLRLPSTLANRSYPQTYRYVGRRTAPWITVRTWRERFVALVAHEACHIRQFKEGLRRSEVEAERWAMRILAAWTAAQPDQVSPAGGVVERARRVPDGRHRPAPHAQLELFALR
jgi:hypothetical protein